MSPQRMLRKRVARRLLADTYTSESPRSAETPLLGRQKPGSRQGHVVWASSNRKVGGRAWVVRAYNRAVEAIRDCLPESLKSNLAYRAWYQGPTSTPSGTEGGSGLSTFPNTAASSSAPAAVSPAADWISTGAAEAPHLSEPQLGSPRRLRPDDAAVASIQQVLVSYHCEQSQAKVDNDALQLKLTEARLAAGEALSSAQLLAGQLSAELQKAQQQVREADNRSANLERLWQQAAEAAKLATTAQQQLAADKSLLTAELHNAKAAQAAQQERLQQLMNDLSAAQGRILLLEKTNQQADTAAQAAAADRASLAEQVMAGKSDRATRQAKLQQLCDELNSVQQQLADAHKKSYKVEMLCQQAVAAAQAAVSAQQQLEADKAALAQELEAARVNQAAQQSQLQQLQREVSAVQQQLKEALQKNTQLKELCQQAETAAQASVEQQQQLAATNESLLQELKQAKAVHEAQQGDIALLKYELAGVQSKLADAQEKSNQLEVLCQRSKEAALNISDDQQQLAGGNVQEAHSDGTSSMASTAGGDTQAEQAAKLQQLIRELFVVQQQLAEVQQQNAQLEHAYKEAKAAAQAALNVQQQLTDDNTVLRSRLKAARSSQAAQQHQLNQELMRVQQELKEGQERSLQLELLCQQATEAVKSANEDQRELTAGMLLLARELEGARSHIIRLSSDLQLAQQQLDTATFKSSQLEELCEQAAFERDGAQQQLAADKAALAKELLEYRTAQAQQQAKMQQLAADLAVAKDRIKQLEQLCDQANEATTSALEEQQQLTSIRELLTEQLREAAAVQEEQHSKLVQLKYGLLALQEQQAAAEHKSMHLEHMCQQATAAAESTAAERVQLDADRALMAQQLRELKSSHAAQHMRALQLTDHLAVTKKQLEESQEESRQLSQMYTQAAATAQAAADARHELIANRRVLEQQLQVAEAAQAEKQAKLQQLAAELTVVQQQLEDTQEASAAAAQSACEVHRELMTDKKLLEQQLQQAQAELAKQQTHLQQLSTELLSVRQQLQGMQGSSTAAAQATSSTIGGLTADKKLLEQQLKEARVMQAEQQTKLQQMTTELAAVQQQLTEAQEMSAALEILCQKANQASQSTTADQQQLVQDMIQLTQELSSERAVQAEQQARLAKLEPELAATQRELASASERVAQLEQLYQQADASALNAYEARQRLLNQKAALMTDLDKTLIQQAALRSRLRRLEAEVYNLNNTSLDQDPDACYRAAVRHLDLLAHDLRLDISLRLQAYQDWPDRQPDQEMDESLSEAFVVCLRHVAAVQSVNVLKQVMQLQGSSYFSACLLQGAAKLLVHGYGGKLERVKALQHRMLTSGDEQQKKSSSSSNNSISKADAVNALLAAAVPYAHDAERQHQQEMREAAIAGTVLYRQQADSSSGGSCKLQSLTVVPMAWSEALEAVAATDAVLRLKVCMLDGACEIDVVAGAAAAGGFLGRRTASNGGGSSSGNARISGTGRSSLDGRSSHNSPAWLHLLRGVYWLGRDYRLAQKLLQFESAVVSDEAMRVLRAMAQQQFAVMQQ